VMKLNFIKVKNLVRYHKQVETRNGLIFMRMKKRPLVFIRDVSVNSAV
jgi:hypothetical protein